MRAVIHTTKRNEIYPRSKSSIWLLLLFFLSETQICLSTLSVDVTFGTTDTFRDASRLCLLVDPTLRRRLQTSSAVHHNDSLHATKANARPPHQNRSGKPVQKLRCQQGDDDDDDRVRTISDALYVAFGTSATRVVQSLELLASGREYKRDHPTKGRQEAESFMYGLRADPWHDVHDGRFAWLERLEKEYETIRDELTNALNNPDLESLGNSIWSKPRTQTPSRTGQMENPRFTQTGAVGRHEHGVVPEGDHDSCERRLRLP